MSQLLKILLVIIAFQGNCNLFSNETIPESAQQTTPCFDFSREESSLWVKLYLNHEYDLLTEKVITKIFEIEKSCVWRLSTEQLQKLDLFVSTLFFVFLMDDYTVDEKYWKQLITLNATTANIISASSFKTADSVIPSILGYKNNLGKLLFLWSSRSSLTPDYKALFSTNSFLASYWYTAYLNGYVSSCADELGFGNLKKHLVNCPDHLDSFSFAHRSTAFVSTYIDIDLDKYVKQRVNNLMQYYLSSAEGRIHNVPNKRKIAVLTANWIPGHSVYRNQYPYLKELSKSFDLTLISFSANNKNEDLSLFKDVKRISIVSEDSINISSILNNDYMIAYYPDVGMSWESVALSNLRIAPLQVTTYGHSVSTYGSKVDYWIAGKDVEALDSLNKNYSEKVVLIPGLGITNTMPSYDIQNAAVRKDKFYINCSWHMQKVNHETVLLLKKIADYCNSFGVHVVFRLFSASKGDEFHGICFTESITKCLGDQIEVIPGLPYSDYMKMMEEAEFSIDSYPFGGCNTVVDSLHIRKPIITIEGNKWYNRIGAGILKKVGLSEWIAKDQNEYFCKICEFILHPEILKEAVAKVRSTNLTPLYNDPQATEGFVDAIKEIIDTYTTHISK